MGSTAYKNRFNEEHYDRINFSLPKGFKDKVKACAVQNGVSVNEYLFRLLCADMDESGNSRLAVKNQFGEKEKDILKKMQVASKYYDMIAGVCVDDAGYHIQLKQGFINDQTGNRTLEAVTMKEIRLMITKSHKVRSDELIEGLDAVTVEQLRKWQIPKKYYCMIESIDASRETGYSIILKQGFFNDYVGSTVIQVDKANTFKSIMKYTHEESTDL